MAKLAFNQNHLNDKDTINYGSYYTPAKIIDLVYELLEKNITDINHYFIVDTSCGYGNFLKNNNACLGADIDIIALQTAKQNYPNCKFYNHNSLQNVSRSQYNLYKNNKVIIVGNPPYNDVTSIIRNEIKTGLFAIDDDLKMRDLGMSFLLSYNKLSADFICVLHPLSYLIKKANFNALKAFNDNYRLIDGVVISSGEFSRTSKITQFPIIIALYEKSPFGMSYKFICGYQFKTSDGKNFKLNQFDRIDNYITKYPNQKKVDIKDAVAFFWTMRDINALKRTKTFIEKEVYNSIRIPKSKFAYYCYADIFKDYIKHVPYYFGNSDIMINNDKFEKIKDAFIVESLQKHSFLSYCEKLNITLNYDFMIGDYFKELLGRHYVD
ncbi:MAG: hypothetical protein LBU09_03805 [Endomicrobium sp.]|jgi:hypothetical protein|nr:hypothetical protein [Endomicrobium sp.]